MLELFGLIWDPKLYRYIHIEEHDFESDDNLIVFNADDICDEYRVIALPVKKFFWKFYTPNLKYQPFYSFKDNFEEVK